MVGKTRKKGKGKMEKGKKGMDKGGVGGDKREGSRRKPVGSMFFFVFVYICYAA